MTSHPDIATIARAAQAHHLAALGALHLAPDEVPGHQSLVLLGPGGPGFWPHVSAAPEFADAAPDPLDRWSHRVITALAHDLGARAIFPWDGPPWPPFTGWARRSGRAWPSPVGLLVHDSHGLMLSFRGALALPHRLALPAAAADLSCNGLLQPGQKMICAGFEPNWALELTCYGDVSSTFVDAFSGADIQRTPGSVTFLSENPWQLETSHPVTGTIGYTPGDCQDESDRFFDFTFTPTSAPGLEGQQFFPFCCRIE